MFFKSILLEPPLNSLYISIYIYIYIFIKSMPLGHWKELFEYFYLGSFIHSIIIYSVFRVILLINKDNHVS